MFFLFCCFYDILTTVLSFFHIPASKLISRQVYTRSLIPTPFDIKIAFLHEVYHWLITLIADPSLSYIKGCRSTNKQISIDSLHHWDGHYWVFTHPLIRLALFLQTTEISTNF